MNPEEPPSISGRTVKFTPKAPPRRRPRPAEPKKEAADKEVNSEQTLKRFNTALQRHQKKVEKKCEFSSASAIGPFSHGITQSSSSKPSDVFKDESSMQSSGFEIKQPDADSEYATSLPFIFEHNVNHEKLERVTKSATKIKKDYIEPWDYTHCYYPTTLPWRKPYSGCPELLDEAEFGEVAQRSEYDESTVNHASELGLLDSEDGNENARLMFFQLPPVLPITKRSAIAKGKDIKCGTASVSQKNSVASVTKDPTGISQSRGLEELPGGKMGVMLVYKSGAVKLKLGETLYDVSVGSDCTFKQDVVVINTKEKHCCVLGELRKRAIVTPDVDSILDGVIDLV